MSKRYGLTLKLDCDNDAFEEGRRADETAKILRKLADELDGHSASAARYAFIHSRIAEGSLFDSNGNRCGAWEAKLHRIRN